MFDFFVLDRYPKTVSILTICATCLVYLHYTIIIIYYMKTESLLALGAGLAAGFVLGVMFAPEKGERTRKKLREAAEQACDAAEDLSNDIREELSRLDSQIQDGTLTEKA